MQATGRALQAGTFTESWPLGLIGGLIAAAFAPHIARACGAVPTCAPVLVALPTDGSVGVPLNVELEATTGPWFTNVPATAVSLRVADTGEDVALVAARTPGRFRPELPLLPGTRYELLAPEQVALRTSDSCPLVAAVLATFTTGVTTDSVPPAELSAMGGGCGVSACGSGGCCGPYVAAISSASWSATDDSMLPVAYAFGSPDGPRTFAGYGSATSVAGSANPLATTLRIPGRSPVFAIDAAGNVSDTSAPFELDLSCQPSPEESAAWLSCDAGPCPDAGPSGRDAGGCSAASAGPSRRPLFAALATVFALLRVRRRRPTPRASRMK